MNVVISTLRYLMSSALPFFNEVRKNLISGSVKTVCSFSSSLISSSILACNYSAPHPKNLIDLT